MGFEFNYVLASYNQHRYDVLVEVEEFGSIGHHPYTVKTIDCGDCCIYQASSEKGRRNMRFLAKLKFWKKRNNKTPTKVNAYVSTEGPRTCDATLETMEPTKVEACVSTEDPRNCDATSLTMVPIDVDAYMSTEDPKKKKRKKSRKRNEKTQTKVDSCVSTEDPRTCEA